MHQSYPDISRLKAVPWFPIAAARLNPPATVARLAQLLGPQATYETVKKWRQGRRGAPQWAVDRLAAVLREQASSDLAIANNGVPGKRTSADIGTLALRRYRLQRALEREKGTV